jgi:hypothetical protein
MTDLETANKGAKYGYWVNLNHEGISEQIDYFY